MQLSNISQARPASDRSIGRIVSVTGSKAIVLLDGTADPSLRAQNDRPEMGTLLAIEQANTVVLAIVSALSVPVPAQREGDSELWIAELGLAGELWRDKEGRPILFTVLDEDERTKSTDEEKFSAPTSMRDVEPSVHLWIERGPGSREKSHG